MRKYIKYVIQKTYLKTKNIIKYYKHTNIMEYIKYQS